MINIKIDFRIIYLKITMNNNEYLRYALAGKIDIIYKLQNDIRRLEMEKKHIINKNHQLVKMATYYKDLSEEKEQLHNIIVDSFEKEIAIYNRREERRLYNHVKPKAMSLRDKLEKIKEKKKRKKLEERSPKFFKLPKI
mgnify:FL=1|tara:strand:+ start:79 stop:495 length:417 start_codon:yes stop_codon:yes gene_type:complete